MRGFKMTNPKRQGRSRVRTINTPVVKVLAKKVAANDQPRKRRNRRRNRGRRVSVSPMPAGLQSGMASLAIARRKPEEEAGITEQSCGFVVLYTDPCGEHNHSQDSARVPDGALQTSAGALFRGLDTIVFPWQQPGQTLVGANGVVLTYSMLVMQLPLLRSMYIVIARETDGEFGPETMHRFAATFAHLYDRTTAIYPQWLSLNDPSFVEYMTIVQTSALSDILPPGPNGVSGTVDSYRFTSQGINLMFNTPDLLNQGTIAAMRYPTNRSEREVRLAAELSGAQVLFGSFTAITVLGVPNTHNITIRGARLADDSPARTPDFSGNSATLPTQGVVATVSMRNLSGTFVVVQGNTFLSYRMVGQQLQLFNGSVGLVLGTLNPNQVGDVLNGDFHLYETNVATNPAEAVVDNMVNTISLPPVTQSDIFQQNPDMTGVLAKEWGGVYLPTCMYEPVFKVTSAASYRKTVLLTKETVLSDLVDPTVGWFDTVDENFGCGVINLQGIPYACKPFVKSARSIEIVPSEGSLVGAFAAGCPLKQPEAIDIAHAFTDLQPQGYPPDYNGLGLLFQKIFACVREIPALLRSGRNIACEVEKVVAETVDTVQEVRQVGQRARRGISRLFRSG